MTDKRQLEEKVKYEPLKPSEFLVGCPIHIEADQLALMIVLAPPEKELIVVKHNNDLSAFTITGEPMFFRPEQEYLNQHDGLIITPISIEVDQTSMTLADRSQPTVGSLIRYEDKLGVNCYNKVNPNGTPIVDLYRDLKKGSGEQMLAFNRWKIFMGSGAEKRCLRTIDVSPQQAPKFFA